jgi:hypothetical protein
MDLGEIPQELKPTVNLCVNGTLRFRSGQAFHPTDEDLSVGTQA